MSKRSLARRLDRQETARGPECRARFVWRGEGETSDAVRERIRAMIARGVASPHDYFIRFEWVPPPREAADN